jgi:hypothetical protein
VKFDLPTPPLIILIFHFLYSILPFSVLSSYSPILTQPKKLNFYIPGKSSYLSIHPQYLEKDQLLEIHLLKKTPRHQNLDCLTLFEQMPKKMKLLKKTQKSNFKQMQFLDQNDQLLELQLLDKNIEKCQLLEFKKVDSLEHVRQFG